MHPPVFLAFPPTLLPLLLPQFRLTTSPRPITPPPESNLSLFLSLSLSLHTVCKETGNLNREVKKRGLHFYEGNFGKWSLRASRTVNTLIGDADKNRTALTYSFPSKKKILAPTTEKEVVTVELRFSKSSPFSAKKRAC